MNSTEHYHRKIHSVVEHQQLGDIEVEEQPESTRVELLKVMPEEAGVSIYDGHFVCQQKVLVRVTRLDDNREVVWQDWVQGACNGRISEKYARILMSSIFLDAPADGPQ